MALDPIELLIVGAVVVVIFLWGPSKIPEMARSLGRAKKEFDTAQRDLQEVTKQFQAESGLASLTGAATSSKSSGTILDRLTGLMTAPVQDEGVTSTQPLPAQLPQTAPAAAATITPPPLPAPSARDSKSADQVLIDTARQLGINTEGKTRQEISQEILARAKAGSSGSSSSVPT
jgi:TatA/E family protein of Tat protein translocase